MNDRERRRLDKYDREMAFMNDNAADFPADSPGGKIAASFTVELQRAKESAARQAAGVDTRAQKIDEKEDSLEELKELLKMLDRAGDALADEIEGIENLFGLPRNRSLQSILAAARAEHQLSAQYEARLLEYDLPQNFRRRLTDLIENIETADEAADVSGAQGSGSTDAFKASLGKMSKKLDAINRNKYRTDPAKLGAWLTASHLQKAPKPSNENQPQTPPA